MKKRMVLIFLGCMLLGGCQKTPEDQVVREKGSASVENYEKAEDMEGTMAEQLSVPERYTAQVETEDKIYTMEADASVQLPEAESMNVYQAEQKEMDQEFIDRFTESFLGDAPVYDSISYSQRTKGEILEELEELKGYQAAGNEDPYGSREEYKRYCQEEGLPWDEETLDSIFNLENQIEVTEQLYAEAPETAEKVKVKPSFGANEDLGEKGENGFTGIAEVGDALYALDFGSGEAGGFDAGFARVQKEREAGIHIWDKPIACEEIREEDRAELTGFPSEEEAEKKAGDLEAAREKAAAYIQSCGLTEFQEDACQLVVSQELTMTNAAVYEEAAWAFYFTRTLDGVPVTYDMNLGGGLESMDSTNEAWPYERCTVIVNQEGLCFAEIANLYEVTGVQVEQVKLKTFPQIAEIFEKMIKIKNSDLGSQGTVDCDQKISRCRLGYMRIYDPGTDSRSGLLVPVWDFYGETRITTAYEGETASYAMAYPYQSIMTVNAIDGTVIDRSLGY